MTPDSSAEPSKLAFSYRNFRFFWATTLLVSFAAALLTGEVHEPPGHGEVVLH